MLSKKAKIRRRIASGIGAGEISAGAYKPAGPTKEDIMELDDMPSASSDEEDTTPNSGSTSAQAPKPSSSAKTESVHGLYVLRP